MGGRRWCVCADRPRIHADVEPPSPALPQRGRGSSPNLKRKTYSQAPDRTGPCRKSRPFSLWEMSAYDRIADICHRCHVFLMNLRSYLTGQRIELVSPLSRPEFVAQINASMPSASDLAVSPCVVGWSSFGGLTVHWHTPGFRNDFRPVFSASLRAESGQTLIRGRWGAKGFTRFCILGLYVLCSYGFLVCALGLAGLAPWNGAEIAILFVLPFFLAMPAVAANLSTTNADQQLQAILMFLERVASAKLVGDSPQVQKP